MADNSKSRFMAMLASNKSKTKSTIGPSDKVAKEMVSKDGKGNDKKKSLFMKKKDKK